MKIRHHPSKAILFLATSMDEVVTQGTNIDEPLFIIYLYFWLRWVFIAACVGFL